MGDPILSPPMPNPAPPASLHTPSPTPPMPTLPALSVHPSVCPSALPQPPDPQMCPLCSQPCCTERSVCLMDVAVHLLEADFFNRCLFFFPQPSPDTAFGSEGAIQRLQIIALLHFCACNETGAAFGAELALSEAAGAGIADTSSLLGAKGSVGVGSAKSARRRRQNGCGAAGGALPQTAAPLAPELRTVAPGALPDSLHRVFLQCWAGWEGVGGGRRGQGCWRSVTTVPPPGDGCIGSVRGRFACSHGDVLEVRCSPAPLLCLGWHAGAHSCKWQCDTKQNLLPEGLLVNRKESAERCSTPTAALGLSPWGLSLQHHPAAALQCTSLCLQQPSQHGTHSSGTRPTRHVPEEGMQGSLLFFHL